jgi:hypothetical protein
VAALQASDEENYHLEKHQQQCMSLLFPKTQLCSKLEPKTPPLPHSAKINPGFVTEEWSLSSSSSSSHNNSSSRNNNNKFLQGI